MHPDNAVPLIAAAARRHELTRAKAVRAVRELDQAGTPITFEAVARAAGVSRSWLYAEADLRSEIERLRDATRRTPPPSPSIPRTQRASDASLRTRLEAALRRNQELTQENQRLRRQLAHALGDQRTAPTGHASAPPPETGSTVALR
jgi:hypothetical protein